MDERNKIKSLLSPIFALNISKQEVQILEGIEADVKYLLIKSVDSFTNARIKESLESLEAVLDVTWEALNTGHWSLVPDSQRKLFAIASLLKVMALTQHSLQSADSTISCLEKAVKAADLGLLLGNSYRDQLTQAACLLTQAININSPAVGRSEPAAGHLAPQLAVSTDPVTVLYRPSLETFSSQHFYPRVPVKITGCMHHWAAMRRWPDLDYLLQVAGARTVPVELGSSYAQTDWSQRLMPLRQFIAEYVTGSASGLGYLAQHQLFDQVPELKKDIVVPEYCACSDSDLEEEGEVDINAWFGPGGTVSPLHHDPKHNLLCQVVGSKRVTLYAPSCSERLYAHEGRLLSNTARVDPENPDYRLFPKYRDTPALSCLLEPGEMLYIPPQWWHHVRALQLSFSVSFWWT